MTNPDEDEATKTSGRNFIGSMIVEESLELILALLLRFVLFVRNYTQLGFQLNFLKSYKNKK